MYMGLLQLGPFYHPERRRRYYIHLLLFPGLSSRRYPETFTDSPAIQPKYSDKTMLVPPLLSATCSQVGDAAEGLVYQNCFVKQQSGCHLDNRGYK